MAVPSALVQSRSYFRIRAKMDECFGSVADFIGLWEYDFPPLIKVGGECAGLVLAMVCINGGINGL